VNHHDNDGEGFVTTNTYDSFEQLTTLTRTIDRLWAVRSPHHDHANTATTSRQCWRHADLGGLNSTSATVYDAFGRVTQSVDTAGKVTATPTKTAAGYRRTDRHRANGRV